MLMDPDDGPSRSWLARKLWESRAAMAEEPDLDSHTDVARWILQAERAVRVCTAAGEVRAGGSQSDHPSA